ncbi:MAG TPA: Ppx/GppA phosphatase family protein, partial [Candidatus Eisenbacteria bacterium]
MRIAAIDIGTNSIHMVIADATRGETFAVLDREREVVQVGRGSFHDGRLRGDAMRRTAAALRRFVQLARRHAVDRILCTATAAVREAKNGGDFLRLARRESGVSPRVIPHEEEGRLIHLAVQAALRLDDRPALLVDIGGGSAQLVHVRGGELVRVVGVPLGALRLTETRLAHDPPTEHEIEGLRRHVRKQLRAAFETLGEPAPERVYGSSGSIHALASLAHWEERGRGLPQVNGHVLQLSALADLTRRLEGMRRDERERLPGIDEARAEILLPGAIVLEHVLRLAGAKEITLSDYGVREGLVTDWIRWHAKELATLEAAGDVRLGSVLGLLARFDQSGRHARHVAALSLRLFDELAPWHELGRREREWLQYAALLHDLGSAIAYDGHAKHSAYAIRHGGLRGLTAEETDIVASIARHHGGSRPRRRRDEDYAALPRRARRAVRWLSAMLRVAEGLDRSHYQLVRDLHVRRRGDTVVIVADAGRHSQLELWAGRRRAADLARLLGRTVSIRPAASERAGARVRRLAAEAIGAPPAAALRVVARASDPAAPNGRRTRSATRDRSSARAIAASAAAPAAASASAAAPAPPAAPRNGHARRPLALP